MTEQELIDQMVTLTTTARSIMQNVQTYGTVDQDVTFTAGGLSVTVPSVPKQVAQFTAQQAAAMLTFHKDFGGGVAYEAVTRDPVTGSITGANVTFASGWSMSHAFTRDLTGKLATINVVIKDSANTTQATFSKSATYDSSNRFSSLA